ncbi:hypothetical protein V1460_18635 [Streptomyces sp. SCSIO 30461]|uniref:hypothetical protein n=1 Tax=Streptomyces sp. SCSIO 30461 TaxID=3118085 RepID=UPI0030D2D540
MSSGLSAREVALLDQLEAALRAAPGAPGASAPEREGARPAAIAVSAAVCGLLFLAAAVSRSPAVGWLAVAVWVTGVLLVSKYLGHGPSWPARAPGPPRRGPRW